MAGSATAGSDFYLHDGDTVVFYGDSITHQRLYTVFTEAYILTRFPQLHVRFIHSGYSGDRVSGGLGGTIDERIERDIPSAYNPTVVTVMLGMNDGEYRPYDAAIFNKYAKGYRYLIKKLKTELPEARLTLLEPSPYDDVTRPPAFPGGYNGVLLRYGESVSSLARIQGAAVADLNSPRGDLHYSAANQVSTEAALDLIPDRVHPSPGIHMIMAEALLKAWHAPSIVTRVEIDAAAGNPFTKEEANAVKAVLSNSAVAYRGPRPTGLCRCRLTHPTTRFVSLSTAPILRKRSTRRFSEFPVSPEGPTGSPSTMK